MPHPGLSPSHTPGPQLDHRGKQCLTQQGGGWVGWGGLSAVRVPSGQSRGPAVSEPPDGAHWPPGSHTGKKGSSGPPAALEREARRRSLGRKELAHRTQPRPAPFLPSGSLLPRSKPESGAPFQPRGQDAAPSGLQGKPDACEGNLRLKVTWGELKRDPRGDSCGSLEVFGNGAGRSPGALGPCLPGAGGPVGALEG